MVGMCWRLLVNVIGVGVLVLGPVVVSCADEERVDSSRSSRDLSQDDFRAMDLEKWRTLEYSVPEHQDWVAADGATTAALTVADAEPALKRRRPGRKRKRRPQTFDREHDDDPYADRLPTRPRPRRPQRLDQRRDQWRDEMLAEEPFRPMRNYNRRRLYPKYEEEETTAKSEDPYGDGDEDLQLRSSQTVQNDEQRQDSVAEKVRDPYTALNQDQAQPRRPYSKRKYPATQQDNGESSTDKPDGAPDLKALLKQSGGISLSELLQQKNLSLADLLKGEQHAISALTEIPEQGSEVNKHVYKLSEDDTLDEPKRYNAGHRRLPSVRKNAKPQEESHEDELTTVRQQVPAQKLRTRLNADTKADRPMFSEFELHDMPVTTDRRIFVPSHPKYYTSVDYKPNIQGLNGDNAPESITTVPPEKTSESFSVVSSTVTFSTSENPTTVKSKSPFKVRPLNTLPTTLAKLKKATRKSAVVNARTENYPTKSATIPPKAFEIDLNELFAVAKVQSSTSASTAEGPLKISVDIGHLFEPPDRNETESNLVITDANKYEQKDGLKTAPVSAKDEIMEILADTVSREHLTRLLKLRNMTVDELVEQRERGSSQKHLADIFHNKTKEPEPADEVVVARIMQDGDKGLPPLFETFPVFKQRPIASDAGQYYTSVVELPAKTRESRQNQLPAKDPVDYNVIGDPVFTGGASKELFGKLVPVWSQAYTNVNKHSSERLTKDERVNEDEARRIEEIESKLAEAVSGGVFAVDVHSRKPHVERLEEDSEFMRLPYGVRSAIIASAAIGGISLLIFFTIFIVFKWTQRHRKQLTYSNSFSSSKIKSPILESPYQGRMFGNLVHATLGRKKLPTISHGEPQSLQDYLWDTDRKPFQ